MSEGSRPFGAYALLKALGRGAMGDVHLARPLDADRGIPTPVVIKRLHGELASKKGFVARFTHEAEIAVNVDSPHVAKVFDAGSVGDTLFITMEYVPGWPLSKVLDAILKSGKHASVASVIDSIAGGLEGLAALHTAKDKSGNPLGIVHRDVSPKNLMIGEDGLMHVIDLGLGKSNAQDWKTRTGVVMGSVGYMPPEQVVGEHVDARADVYAMAVVAFEMLALRNYVKRGPLAQMMSASHNPKFQKPSDFRPDIPAGLDEVLRRALAPSKEDRYQSSKEFLQGLRSVVPATHSSGGMRALLEDLFGETKQERERELAELMALPLPIELLGEEDKTNIFVQRAGVSPSKTRIVSSPQNDPDAYKLDAHSIPPTVATEVSGFGRDASFKKPVAIDVATDPTAPSLRMSSHTATISLPAKSLSSTGFVQPVAVKSGVSMPVLIASILVAAIVGGMVAVVLSQRMIAPQSQQPVNLAAEPAPEDPAPAIRAIVTQQQKVEPKDEPVTDVPEKAPKRPSTVHREPKEQKTAAVEEAAAVEVSPEDEAKELLFAIDGLIRSLPEGPQKTKAIEVKLALKTDISTKDKDRVKQSLRRNRAELDALRASLQ